MTKFFRFTVLMAVLAVSAMASARADDDESYEAYDECIKQLGKDIANFRYPGIVTLSMRKLHKKMAKDANSCVAKLPEDERKDAAYHLRGITLLTQPTDLSGTSDGRVILGTGVVVQTGTGASLVLSGEAGLFLPKSSLFVMTEGYDLRLSGTAYVGSTDSQFNLPRLRVGATVTKGIKASFRKDERKKISDFVEQLAPTTDKKEDEDALEPLLKGFDDASLAHVVELMFDRDKAMDRAWEVSAGYGLQASLAGRRKGVSARVLGEVGAGASEDETIPFVRINLGGKGFYCPWSSKNKKHLFCVSAELAAKVGLAQAGIGVNAGANYRYKISNDSRGWLNKIEVGPSGYADTFADPTGGHNVSGAMFGIKVE